MTKESKVIFHFPNGDIIETPAYTQLNILAHGQIIERSLQSRCGGHCRCGTCRIYIKSGKVSPMKSEEQDLLQKVTKGQLPANCRLACQVFPEPNEVVEIEVPANRYQDAREGGS